MFRHGLVAVALLLPAFTLSGQLPVFTAFHLSLTREPPAIAVGRFITR